MKRYFSFVLVALFSLGFATTTWAQEAPKNVTVNFDEPRSAKIIIEAIAKESGLRLGYDDILPGSVMFQGPLNFQDPIQGIEKVVRKVGFTAVQDEQDGNTTIHVRRVATPTPAAQAVSPTPVIGGVTQATGDIESPFYMQRAVYGNGPSQPMMPAIAPYGAGAQARPQGYGSYGYGGSNVYYDPYWQEYQRQYQNRGDWGRLKIDGPERFLQGVHVFVDGHPYSPASKANDATNEGLAIPAGLHDIQLMWLDNEVVKVLSWRGYEIRPMMVQKTNWVGGKKGIYERAPKATAEEEATYRQSLGLTVGVMR